MAKKEISIIVKARNAMAAGLASAGSALKKFGESARRIGAFFAKAFLAAGTAIAGFAVKALQAFSVQEKAEKEAAAAFRAYGEEVTANVENVKRFASAIQDETGVADESTVALAARLKMLGVGTDQLEQAAKATIALKAAGMDEAAAGKAVAQAMNGEFTMLSRYLPALKSATTEEEKAAIVNDFLTKGYATQKDALNTVAGQWGALKGRVGDAWEEVGAAIAQNGVLTDILGKAGDAVKGLGEKIKQWVSGGGVQRLIQTMLLFGENVRNVFNKAGIQTSTFFKAFLWNPGKQTFQYLTNVIAAWLLMVVANFKTIGIVAANTWERIKNPFKKIPPPDLTEFKTALKDLVDNLKGKFVDEMPDAVGEGVDKEIAEEERHRNKVKEIFDSMAKMEKDAADKAVAVEENKQEQITIAAENTAKKKKKDSEAAAKAEEQAADDAIKQIDKKVDALEKEKDAADKVVEKGIQGILEQAKADKEKGNQEDKEAKRAAELTRRAGMRGRKLSAKDQAWLDAFNKVQAAKNQANVAGQNIQQAQKQLNILNDQKEKLKDIVKVLGNIDDNLEDNLERE